VFEDGSVYWLKVFPGSVLPGDTVAIAECSEPRKVRFASMTLPDEYFEGRNPVPHRFGTFIELARRKE
jgi:hypothetical protein